MITVTITIDSATRDVLTVHSRPDNPSTTEENLLRYLRSVLDAAEAHIYTRGGHAPAEGSTVTLLISEPTPPPAS